MRPVIVLWVVAFSAPILRAQQPPPSLDAVLDRYAQALGGKAEYEKTTSVVIKGTIDFPDFGASGTTTEYFQRPNRLAAVTEIEGFGTVRMVCDGTTAWSENPQAGLRQMTGQQLSDMVRRSDPHWPIKLKEYYPGIKIKDRETVDGQDAWVLEATLDGARYRWYFDTGKGEMIRFDTETGKAETSNSILIGDYRPVGTLRFAFGASFSSAQLKWNRKLSEVRFNAPIDDAVFAKPDAKKPAAQ